MNGASRSTQDVQDVLGERKHDGIVMIVVLHKIFDEKTLSALVLSKAFDRTPIDALAALAALACLGVA